MLTQHQQDKKEELLSLIRDGHKRVVLKGSAGVGKTFLVQELITAIRRDYKRSGMFYITAPTNKALAVIKGKVQQTMYTEFKTIHSALCLVRHVDNITGEKSYVPSKYAGMSPFSSASLCIMDEASMLSNEMLTHLKNFPGMLTIFVGDEKQLPPVKEAVSPIFSQGYPEVELTEIIRQGAGNPIIDLSRNLSEIRNRNEKVIQTESSDFIGYTFTINKDKVINALAEVNGSDDIKYLAWTNANVDSINRQVRNKIYGNPGKVELGETLIFNKPHLDYYTNEEIKVGSLVVILGDFPYPTTGSKFSKGKLVVNDGQYDKEELSYYYINNSIKVLHEKSADTYRKLCADLKADCKKGKKPWVSYYWFTEQFADITYGHAITIHKSQGSTFKKAILNMQDINHNSNKSEKEKLLYTAITRASNLVILFN